MIPTCLIFISRTFTFNYTQPQHTAPVASVSIIHSRRLIFPPRRRPCSFSASLPTLYAPVRVPTLHVLTLVMAFVLSTPIFFKPATPASPTLPTSPVSPPAGAKRLRARASSPVRHAARTRAPAVRPTAAPSRFDLPTHLAPVIRPSSPRTPVRPLTPTPPPPPPPPPHRKPHGYWNHLANLERELLLANAQLGLTGRRAVPRIADLSAIGRGDLVAALAKHGGVKKVAVALNWPRASQRAAGVGVGNNGNLITVDDNLTGKNNVSMTITSSKPTRRARAKVCRRPAAYWSDVRRLHAEIAGFIEEFGVRGVMPTRKQFYSFGRADLANAAAGHGGLRITAQAMGLRGRKACRPRGYWRDFETVREVISSFASKHCPGLMPTADELAAKGQRDVVNAIAAHGGFPEVARRCGLVARNVKKQGAPVVWDEARVRREYLSFLMRYYPRLARERVMVGEKQLREHGRNDLSYAIGKLGGFTALRQRLGLKKRAFRETASSKDKLA